MKRVYLAVAMVAVASLVWAEVDPGADRGLLASVYGEQRLAEHLEGVEHGADWVQERAAQIRERFAETAYFGLGTKENAVALIRGESVADQMSMEQAFALDSRRQRRPVTKLSIDDLWCTGYEHEMLQRHFVRIFQNGYTIRDGVALSLAAYWMTRYQQSGAPGQLHDGLSALRQPVIRWMRQNGMPVVATDDVNPVAEQIQPFIEAANAPMMQGMEEEFERIGIVAPVIDRSDARIAELERVRDDVWSGLVVRPSGGQLNLIRYLLGTEGFNAWVEAYNQ